MSFFSDYKKFKWLILIPLVLVLLFAVSRFLPNNPNESIPPTGTEISSCQREFEPKNSSGPYYYGELFDSHYHIPPAPGIRQMFIKQPVMGKDITINEVRCTFDKEGVKKVLAFYMPKKTNILSLPQAVAIKEYLNDRIYMFISPIYINNKEMEEILDKNPKLFAGIGEIFFYNAINLFRPIDGDWALKIYKLAGERDLPVMIHPGFNQLEKLGEVLSKNPETNFILHGHEMEQQIHELMKKYPKLYYTIDSSSLYSMRGKFIRGPENEFIEEFKRDFNSILDEKVLFWQDKINNYPDRFMWGTDKSTTWNYSEEMSVLMEEFARAFIGRLSADVQEKVAFKNAENLFK